MDHGNSQGLEFLPTYPVKVDIVSPLTIATLTSTTHGCWKYEKPAAAEALGTNAVWVQGYLCSPSANVLMDALTKASRGSSDGLACLTSSGLALQARSYIPRLCARFEILYLFFSQ